MAIIRMAMPSGPRWAVETVTSYAYQGVAEEMKRYEPARWQAYTAKQRKDVADMHSDRPEPPKSKLSPTARTS